MKIKLLFFLVGIMLFSVENVKATEVVLGNITYTLSEDNLTAEVKSFDKSTTVVVIPTSVTFERLEYKVISIGDNAFSSCSGLASITLPSGLVSIGDWAFSSCSGLTSITLPSDLVSIGDWAFSFCSGLASITLPSDLTSIGREAFAKCVRMREFVVDTNNPIYSSIDGVLFNKDKTDLIFYPNAKATTYVIPSGVTSIGNGAFSYCESLASITLPSGLASIGDWAFSCCSGLTSITLPSGLVSIGDNAFSYCSGLASIILSYNLASIGNSAFFECSGLTSLILPAGLTSIGSEAFGKCARMQKFLVDINNPVYSSIDGVLFNKNRTDLISYPNAKATSYVIPSGVTSIGNGAFLSCSELTSITFPSGLLSIGNRAFPFCKGLTSLTLPSSVTSIGYDAFSSCSGLTSLTLPSDLTSIGISAFWDCSGLTSLTLPSGLISIDSNAFKGCDGLMFVRCAACVPPTVLRYSIFDQTLYNKPLYVPVGSREAYMVAYYWNKFSNIIEDAGLSISEHNPSNLITYTDGIIILSDSEMPAQVDVYTSDGKKAATSWIASGGSCDINYLPSGLYIVNVKAGDKMMSRKIVK